MEDKNNERAFEYYDSATNVWTTKMKNNPPLKKKEEVNHPDWYSKGRKYEPIDVIIDWDLDFCLGSALKYISRAGRKVNSIDDFAADYKRDLEKAIWYLKKSISDVTCN